MIRVYTRITQHRLLVMDLEIKKERKREACMDNQRSMGCGFTKDKSQELGEKEVTTGAWRGVGT